MGRYIQMTTTQVPFSNYLRCQKKVYLHGLRFTKSCLYPNWHDISLSGFHDGLVIGSNLINLHLWGLLPWLSIYSCFWYLFSILTRTHFWMLAYVEQFLKKESDSMHDVTWFFFFFLLFCKPINFFFIALLGHREKKHSSETRESSNWGKRSSRKVKTILFLLLYCCVWVQNWFFLMLHE